MRHYIVRYKESGLITCEGWIDDTIITVTENGFSIDSDGFYRSFDNRYDIEFDK